MLLRVFCGVLILKLMSFSHRKFSCYFYFTFLTHILCSFFLEILLLKFLLIFQFYLISTGLQLFVFVSFFWHCSFWFSCNCIFICGNSLHLFTELWSIMKILIWYFFIHLSKVTNVFNLNFSSISLLCFPLKVYLCGLFSLLSLML